MLHDPVLPVPSIALCSNPPPGARRGNPFQAAGSPFETRDAWSGAYRRSQGRVRQAGSAVAQMGREGVFAADQRPGVDVMDIENAVLRAQVCGHGPEGHPKHLTRGKMHRIPEPHRPHSDHQKRHAEKKAAIYQSADDLGAIPPETAHDIRQAARDDGAKHPARRTRFETHPTAPRPSRPRALQPVRSGSICRSTRRI